MSAAVDSVLQLSADVQCRWLPGCCMIQMACCLQMEYVMLHFLEMESQVQHVCGFQVAAVRMPLLSDRQLKRTMMIDDFAVLHFNLM